MTDNKKCKMSPFLYCKSCNKVERKVDCSKVFVLFLDILSRFKL